jgi:hypothetical protein
MVGGKGGSYCCAPNCSSSQKKGFRLFGFPTDVERRKRWIVNTRLDRWTPHSGSRLCEVSYENFMYVSNYYMRL